MQVLGSTSRVRLPGGDDVSDEPRTWTIQEAVPGFASVQGNPPFTEPPVKVVELEPMLELLEQLVTPMDTISAEDESLKAAEALLREHGRLEET